MSTNRQGAATRRPGPRALGVHLNLGLRPLGLVSAPRGLRAGLTAAACAPAPGFLEPEFT